MPLPPDLPVVDHHCHLSPTGEGVAAMRRFRAAGGTHVFLATQNYAPSPPTTLEAYREQFDRTLALARQVEAEAEVKVYPVVAPYPVDLIPQIERLGAREAMDLEFQALELAGHLVEEQRVVALGEVGRPHFPVSPEVAGAAEEVFRRALEVGRDAGCPVVLHSEDLGPEGFRGLADFAARAAFPLPKLVKHYHRAVLPREQYLGIVPSYLARRPVVEAALTTEGPWFLETDYLDDPARPGAVLDADIVPRRARFAFERDPAAAERLRIPFQSAVQAVYGFLPEVAAKGGPA